MFVNRIVVLAIVLLCAASLSGCGGSSGLPSSSAVTVSVTPAQSTIPVGGTVTLHASVSGFTKTPDLQWWMQEQHDNFVDGSLNCDDINAANQALIPTCHFGYIVVESMDETTSTATYHAPQTAGTYHVTMRATQWGNTWTDGFFEKRATATITVQ